MTEPRTHFAETLLDTSTQDRDRFTCGKEPLDRYIRTQAGQDVKRGLAVVHVVVPVDDSTRIAGYYTLSSLSIELTALPPKAAKKLPYASVPSFLLGRLAVDSGYQGTGLGGYLLSMALRKCLDVATTYIAGRIVVVDALDEGAAAFYLKYGFTPLKIGTGYPMGASLPPRE